MTGSDPGPLPRGGRERVLTLDPPRRPAEPRTRGRRPVVSGTLTCGPGSVARGPSGSPGSACTRTIRGTRPAVLPDEPGYPGTCAQSGPVLTADGGQPLPARGTWPPLAGDPPIGGTDRFDEMDGDSCSTMTARMATRWTSGTITAASTGRPGGRPRACSACRTSAGSGGRFLRSRRTPRTSSAPVSRGPPGPAPVVYAGARRPAAQLDPQSADDLAEIVLRQQRLVDVAALRHRFVALLDVPSGLPVAGMSTWRAASTPASRRPTTPGCGCRTSRAARGAAAAVRRRRGGDRFPGAAAGAALGSGQRAGAVGV